MLTKSMHQNAGGLSLIPTPFGLIFPNDEMKNNFFFECFLFSLYFYIFFNLDNSKYSGWKPPLKIKEEISPSSCHFCDLPK